MRGRLRDKGVWREEREDSRLYALIQIFRKREWILLGPGKYAGFVPGYMAKKPAENSATLSI